MFRKKVYLTLFAVLVLCISGLWAGDTASFVDLGFSPDGKIYMFAQYGVESRSLKPWADLFIVDVPRNNFVSGGRVSYVHDSPVVPGQDGSGALYRLIAQNAQMAERYKVNYCFQGQPLFIAVDNSSNVSLFGNAAATQAGFLPAEQVLASNSPIEFRDFDAGTSYKASLVPSIEGSGSSLRSSFYINLERTTRNGVRTTYTVGTPHLKRPLIISYRIQKVMIAPQDGSMIFLIEMRRQDGGNVDIRYMVEALRL